MQGYTGEEIVASCKIYFITFFCRILSHACFRIMRYFAGRYPVASTKKSGCFVGLHQNGHRGLSQDLEYYFMSILIRDSIETFLKLKFRSFDALIQTRIRISFLIAGGICLLPALYAARSCVRASFYTPSTFWPVD